MKKLKPPKEDLKGIPPYILYHLIDEHGIPFYIGVTADLDRRKREHIRDFKKRKYKFEKFYYWEIHPIIVNTNPEVDIMWVESLIIAYDKLTTKLLKNTKL